MSTNHYLWQTVKITTISLSCLLFLRTFIIEPSRINGRSMENTYLDEDIFLADKISLLLKTPQRGDLVQAIDPYTKKIIIKRIVGLPDDQLEIKRNKIYLIDKTNQKSKLYPEPYLKPNMLTKSQTGKPTTYTVPANHYFLLGDNRPLSTDSRVYGPLHRSFIFSLASLPIFK